MLGASDVGKSYLTSQFMSSNDVSAYGNDDQFGKEIIMNIFEKVWKFLRCEKRNFEIINIEKIPTEGYYIDSANNLLYNGRLTFAGLPNSQFVYCYFA